MEVTHPDKIYWKKEHISKGEMVRYYEEIAPFILPYLKNHPVMLKRYPDGIEGDYFYQKDIKNHPKSIKTVGILHEHKKVEYLLIQDLESLIWAANLGSIELHPWIMDYKHLEKPTYLVVDLDPVEVPFKEVVQLAQSVHRFLDTLEAPNFCKTSGGRGLHLYIPLHSKYTFEQTEQFAKMLAHLIQMEHPDLVSLERRPVKRQKKIYFDFLQNLHGGRTMVAPYSLRARPNAPVSTPLFWNEVNGSLDPLKFTIETVPKRLEKKGDPFKGVLGKGVDLKAVVKKIEDHF